MEIFRHKKENKRREGERRRRYPVFWGVALLLLGSSLFVYMERHNLIRLVAHLRERLLSHSYFSVREIKVNAGEKVGGSEIVVMAGLSHGMSIWKIDPKAIEETLAKHPWVKRVLVRREFPRRVVIEVEERVAKGIAVLGRLYYVDPEGFIFKEVKDGEKVDFPLLTGLQQAELTSQSPSTRHRIQEALRLGELMAGGLLAPSEIRFLPQGGVVVYAATHPIALHMGWGNWEEKTERLGQVWGLWKGRENRLAALDLRFRGQVLARTRKG